MAIRPKIVALAQHITGSDKEFTEDHAAYYGIECVVDDDQADVLLAMELRRDYTAKELAEKTGKPLEEVIRILEREAWVGMIERKYRDNGEDLYLLPIFVPGSMEAMVMNRTLIKEYPQIARAFESLAKSGKNSAMVPIGGAGMGMHVVPIESGVETGTRMATFEQLSEWLRKYDTIAVGDCSCRVSRRIMGEGCGHLEHDVCLTVGHMAEHGIKVGFVRQITYEEALEILKKAEDNGLMHQITNLDGPDKIFGICNCCRCSCFAMRNSYMYGTPNMSRSNFVAKIDSDKCVACGQCVEYCPANAVKLGRKICSKTPIVNPVADLPDDLEWGKDRMNVNYRDSKENVEPSGTAPCKAICPAHIAVQGYIKLASEGRYIDALELIKKENPFPAVCGRICPHVCEEACTRGDLDEPLAIDEVKKFIADRELIRGQRFIPKRINEYGKKMAVVGAGPAGLSCAYYLAIDGYKVTVFEKENKLGGMLTLGIPSFRLEKNVVDAEIEILRDMGVEFKTGVEIGKDFSIRDLRADGFESIYLAIGAQAGRKLGIEGEDAEGVAAGVDFLRDINLDKEVVLKGKTVVIGGGNVAIDVARSAARVGSDSVAMYCLESAAEMPALPEEQEEAKNEGIAINNGWGPVRVVTKDGRVAGVEFKKCVSVFDEEHRFAPKYDDSTTITVEADNVLISVGQSIVWGNMLDGLNVTLNGNGTVKAEELTYATGEKDIFAGGDVVTGPKFAIDAIAAGKQGAISMHRAVWPGQSLTIGRDRRVFTALDKENVDFAGFDNKPREIVIKKMEPKKFEDDRVTFTEEQLKKEAERCLGCGVSVVDQNICVGCGLCTTKCRFDAIKLIKKFDSVPITLEQAPEVIMEHYAEREAAIAARKEREAAEGK